MNAKISERILRRIAEGHSLSEAIDAVLGVGWYDTIVDIVYEGLREKTNAAGSRTQEKEA